MVGLVLVDIQSLKMQITKIIEDDIPILTITVMVTIITTTVITGEAEGD